MDMPEHQPMTVGQLRGILDACDEDTPIRILVEVKTKVSGGNAVTSTYLAPLLSVSRAHGLVEFGM